MIFLNPCNDVAFKRIFGSEEHKSITISFLNSILELTGNRAIVSITFLNTEQLPQTPDKKDNIIDVFCVDQAGTKYIVEMQVARAEEFGKRIVYYGAKAYSMQLGKGRPYLELMPVVVLSIVNFILFPQKKDYKSIHEILDRKTHEHDLPELAFAFVELPKFRKKEHQLVTTEDKWLYFVKEIKKQNHIPAVLDQDEFVEACEIADRMSWSEADLYKYDDAFIRETTRQSALKLADKEGEERGKIKGKQEGVKEGRQEGLKEGEKKARQGFAQQLLQSPLALTVADIVRLTGLTEEEILDLQIK